MLAIPRVEVRGGVCVRPTLPDDVDSYTIGDPISVTRGWAQAGFRRVHVVDADACAGNGSNASLIEEIVRDGWVEVQVSEGAQSSEEIERVVSLGAVRVVLGSRALEEPDWLAGAADLYPGLLVVATDVRERRVVTRGWVRSLPVDILDLVSELNGFPLGGLLLSPGQPFGQRNGFDLSLVEDVADACAFPLFAEGGVSSTYDLRALEHRGVSAALLGEPLYAGTLDARSVAMEFAE